MLNRVGARGRVLLVACLFTASIFVIALKLMNPTEIHIFLEGEETVLSHVLRSYSLYDVAVLVASTFLAGISGTILLLHDADHYSDPGSWRGTAAAMPEILAAIERGGLRTAPL